VEAFDQMLDQLRARMIELAADGHGDPAACAEAAVRPFSAILPTDLRVSVTARLIADAAGVGPIEQLLNDPEIDEVMINGHAEVWVERRGRLELTDARFASAEVLRDCIDRLLASSGRRVDDLSPIADARLPNGSRVNVALPPLAVNGPTVTIRKFREGGMSLSELSAERTLPEALAQLLAAAVANGASIVVSGATGSGKTTTLGALARAIPAAQRVVTIEDSAELVLKHPHVVRLESRPAGPSGNGQVTIRDLVRNSLRMRPDRIVVGEVRGAEVLDMLDAMSTGHAGSLSTVHASSPDGALSRLSGLAQLAAPGVPHPTIIERLCDAIDLIVQQERLADGRRIVSAVAEVCGGDGGLVKQVYCCDGTTEQWSPSVLLPTPSMPV